MALDQKNLGKLLSSHHIDARHLQRAAIIAILAFIFFLAMIAGFFFRGHIGYFLLATGFLVVLIFTFFSWVKGRSSIVYTYDSGIKFRDFSARWNELQPAKVVTESAGRRRIEIFKNRSKVIVVPSTFSNFSTFEKIVAEKLGFSD